MRSVYYDRDGRSISRKQWQRLSREAGYSRVGYADGTRYGREVTVVTYWLGIAAGESPAGAAMFHTYASIRRPAGRRGAYQRLWSWLTLEQARTGHQQAAAWITDVAAWLAGAASQLPGPPPGADGFRSPADDRR